MVTLGVSVYPDIRPLDEIKDYLRLCSKYGFTRVFSSMFSVEGTKEEVLAYFRDLIEAAHEVGMKVSLDVNPMCMEKLGCTPDDIKVFDDIKCDIIRMDMSYGDEGDLKLIGNPYGIQIQFNASSNNFVQNLLDKGADLNRMLVGHNFDPQRYTGLKWNKFLETNANLAKTGVRIEAFVASHAPNTHGVWDAVCGLPTVEMMRDMPIDLQARLLMATGNVTDILIGNAYASEEELASMADLAKDPEIDWNNQGLQRYKRYMGNDYENIVKNMVRNQKIIKVKLVDDITPAERESLFDFFPHSDPGDSSEWIWRCRGPRLIYGDANKDRSEDMKIKVRPYDKEYFEVGDVVIVNENYDHYAGEIQIVRIPIINDGTHNLIGHIDDQEYVMMQLIKDGDLVKFVEK